jgi:hypothetical protein
MSPPSPGLIASESARSNQGRKCFEHDLKQLVKQLDLLPIHLQLEKVNKLINSKMHITRD